VNTAHSDRGQPAEVGDEQIAEPRAGQLLHLDLLATAPAPPVEPAGSCITYADADGQALALAADVGPTVAHAELGPGIEISQCVSASTFFDQQAAPGGSHLFVVFFPVPRANLATFDEWFCEEHAIMLLSNKMWNRARLAAPLAGPWSRIAVHNLESPEAMDSDERRAAATTPLSLQVIDKSWAAGIHRFVGAQAWP
jgi:hypothetical protein